MWTEISKLKGLTLSRVRRVGLKFSEELVFTVDDPKGKGEFKLEFSMGHNQDYSERVWIEGIDGDLQDLVGSTILMAEVVTQGDGEQMWTFYKLATVKGYVTIRWCGESNGYYSVDVDVSCNMKLCCRHPDCQENALLAARCAMDSQMRGKRGS